MIGLFSSACLTVVLENASELRQQRAKKNILQLKIRTYNYIIQVQARKLSTRGVTKTKKI